VPVAAPSANRFGHTSPTTAAHVLADLDGQIDAILDAGACEVGVESTVIDPTADPPVIYRPGGISLAQLRRVLGNVVVAERNVPRDAPPESLESPGLGIRHYAPRARLVLVESAGELDRVLEREAGRHRVGVLLPSEWSVTGVDVTVVPWGSWSQPASLARELYRQLRALDDRGVDLIVCPMPPAGDGIGLAIRDRLRKAAK
jgi:L-threonylcarbamoyladenylate synthase